MSKPPPPAPTASAVGPCPTIIQIVGRPGTGPLHHPTTPRIMSGRSVNLTTLFLGRLRPPKRLTSTSCTYFRQ